MGAIHDQRETLDDDYLPLAQASIASIEKDPDLSIDGKKRKRKELAQQALDTLEQGESLHKARESCAQVLKMWQTKIHSVLTKPRGEDAAGALLHREIRDRYRSLTDERERLMYLERYGSDPQIASALLTGPDGLTALSTSERALLWRKVEQHCAPEVIQARDKVTSALSYRAAKAMLMKAGNLDKEMPKMPKEKVA